MGAGGQRRCWRDCLELKAMLENRRSKLGPVVEYPLTSEAYADLANKRLDYVINVVISVNDWRKPNRRSLPKGLRCPVRLYGGRFRKTPRSFWPT